MADSDTPIPGPRPVGPEYPWEPDWDRPVGPSLWLARILADFVRKPAHWMRENIVEPNRGPKYYWYHKKFKRALPIDECYHDDLACIYEADVEYKRIRMVDRATLALLKQRLDNCYNWNSTRKGGPMLVASEEECGSLKEVWERERENFHIKYGEQHFQHSVTQAYTRQKVRMIAERRRDEKFKSQAQESESS